MKIVKPIKVETGFYPWGPIKGMREFAITFETIEDESLNFEKDPNFLEKYQELAQKTFQEFEKLVKESGLKEAYADTLYPDTKYPKSRFLFKGTNLDQDHNVKMQITFFFNKLSEASIIAFKLVNGTPRVISVDAEVRALSPSLDNILTLTPREIQENSYYRKFNTCLVELDCISLQESWESVINLQAFVEIKRHGQAYFNFIVHQNSDLDFITKEFITSKLLDVNCGNVMITPAVEYDDNLEDLIKWTYDNSFRLEPSLQNIKSDLILKAF